jgi:hypothetical protein
LIENCDWTAMRSTDHRLHCEDAGLGIHNIRVPSRFEI